MSLSTDPSEELVARVRRGDRQSFEALLEHYRARLRQMVALRMHPRMQARVDPSDVVQETYVTLWKRIDDFLANPNVCFFLWARRITEQRLVDLHRRIVGAMRRDTRREVGLSPTGELLTNSESPGSALVASTTPSRAAVRSEGRRRVWALLERLDATDRRILTLRHLEHMGNREAATVLGIEPAAASKRYLRALARFRELMAESGAGSTS